MIAERKKTHGIHFMIPSPTVHVFIVKIQYIIVSVRYHTNPTTGRSRLPLKLGDFEKRFNVKKAAKDRGDRSLPKAFTCFFRLHLPTYSSIEVAQKRIKYAIYNTIAMDADDIHNDDVDVWRDLENPRHMTM